MRLSPPTWSPVPRWGGASLARLLVGLLAVVSILQSQLQVVIHRATVQHVVCAEHDGAVEDLRPVRASAAVSAQDHDDRPTISAAHVEDHGHKDCSLLGLGTLAVRSQPAPTFEDAPHLAGTDAPAPAELGARGPPLLSLAPKQSPPQV